MSDRSFLTGGLAILPRSVDSFEQLIDGAVPYFRGEVVVLHIHGHVVKMIIVDDLRVT